MINQDEILSEKIFNALIYAAKMHHNSPTPTRKYTNEPYIVHPIAVAKQVAQVTVNENMIQEFMVSGNRKLVLDMIGH